MGSAFSTTSTPLEVDTSPHVVGRRADGDQHLVERAGRGQRQRGIEQRPAAERQQLLRLAQPGRRAGRQHQAGDGHPARVRGEAVAAAGAAEPVLATVDGQVRRVGADHDGHAADRIDGLDGGRAPARGRRRSRPSNAHRPHDLRHDRQGDLLGGGRADLHADRACARGPARRRSARASSSTAAPRLWLATSPINPTPASRAARIDSSSKRPWLDTSTAVAPAGLAGPSPSRLTANPSGSASAATASAIGEVPTTARSGAGSRGSRKISTAPPDRHGLTTVRAPGASGNASSPSGRTRSSRGSPLASTSSDAVRTEPSAH